MGSLIKPADFQTKTSNSPVRNNLHRLIRKIRLLLQRLLNHRHRIQHHKFGTQQINNSQDLQDSVELTNRTQQVQAVQAPPVGQNNAGSIAAGLTPGTDRKYTIEY